MIPSESRLRRAVALEWATVGWNAVEAVLALAFGIASGSLALTAFGVDSVIEVFSAGVVLRELREHGRHASHAERGFLRAIGVTFFLLAAYIVVEAFYDLTAETRPHRSVPGIVLTAASLVAMALLARAKHREGHRIACRPLIADSRETRLCSLLSAVTLLGLVLNAAFWWWWADPLAALGIALLAVQEGIEAVTGEHPEHH